MEYTKLKAYGTNEKLGYLKIVKESDKTITLAEYILTHHSKEWVKVGQKRFKIKDFNEMIDCGLLQYVLEG